MVYVSTAAEIVSHTAHTSLSKVGTALSVQAHASLGILQLSEEVIVE